MDGCHVPPKAMSQGNSTLFEAFWRSNYQETPDTPKRPNQIPPGFNGMKGKGWAEEPVDVGWAPGQIRDISGEMDEIWVKPGV